MNVQVVEKITQCRIGVTIISQKKWSFFGNIFVVFNDDVKNEFLFSLKDRFPDLDTIILLYTIHLGNNNNTIKGI